MQDDAKLLASIRDYINEKDDYNKDEPFYIVDLNKIVSQYHKWITTLPNIKPYFAIKSNPDLKIIRLLAELGCNFDCASRNEIATILNITNDPARIIFANPCKSITHIEYAKDNDVNLMTFDSIEELFKIKQGHPTAQLLLRLCVDDSDSICKFNSKFGCKMEDVERVLQTVSELDLNLVGFSFHVGSGCQNPVSYYKALQDCKLACVIASHYDIPIKIIDIGGGFPASNTAKISFESIADNIIKAQNEFFKHKIQSGELSFIAEPGRYFTECTHTLVVNVIAKKREYDIIKYYLNEGVYGSFNCIHFDHQYPVISILNKSPINATNMKSIFFGPTCDSMDVIYKNISFPELQVGDWLYVKNFGSYTSGIEMSFNGFCLTEYKYIYPEQHYPSSPVSSDSSVDF